jgi:D-lactate dehydrogenase
LGVRTGVLFNGWFGQDFMKKLTLFGKKAIPSLPRWSNQMQAAVLPETAFNLSKETNDRNHSATSPLTIVYFSSCISRMMGGDIFQTFASVCRKANVSVIIPKESTGTCCGQIFSSKGFAEAYRLTANQTLEKLWRNSEEGKIPIVMDVTSCTQTLKSSRSYLTDENKVRFDKLTLLDVIDFASDVLLPRLKITTPKDKIVFHPVCSVHKMGSMGKLQRIGKACSAQADIPAFAGCCGMAGDRGFYYPELTKAATKNEATEVKQINYDGYYSTSKTCEMALSEAVGKNYESILKLLDEVSS